MAPRSSRRWAKARSSRSPSSRKRLKAANKPDARKGLAPRLSGRIPSERSEVEREVVGVEAHAFAPIKPVRRLALHARKQAQVPAPRVASEGRDPVEELAAVSLRAVPIAGHEVLDLEIAAAM